MRKSHRSGVAADVTSQRIHFSRGFLSTLLQDTRNENSGSQFVTMMQAPEPGHGYDPATCIRICRGDSTLGRLLLQCEMCPVVVVITDVLTHQAFQMGLVEHDHMDASSCSRSVPVHPLHRSPRARESDLFLLHCAA